MNPEDCAVLKKALERKRVRRTSPMVTPPVVPPPALVNFLVAPLSASTPTKGEVAPLVAQVPSSLSGDGGQPEKVSMEVESIATLSDETFVMEVIPPSKKVSKGATNTPGPLKGMTGTISPLTTSSHAKRIGTTRPPVANPLVRLISTIFGTTNPLVRYHQK